MLVLHWAAVHHGARTLCNKKKRQACLTGSTQPLAFQHNLPYQPLESMKLIWQKHCWAVPCHGKENAYLNDVGKRQRGVKSNIETCGKFSTMHVVNSAQCIHPCELDLHIDDNRQCTRCGLYNLPQLLCLKRSDLVLPPGKGLQPCGSRDPPFSFSYCLTGGW